MLFETALQNTGKFSVIEQTRAELILRAQEYSLSDYTDEACAIQIGNILSAKFIVLGTAGTVGNLYYLNILVSSRAAMAIGMVKVFFIGQMAPNMMVNEKMTSEMAGVYTTFRMAPNKNRNEKMLSELVSECLEIWERPSG